MAAANLCSGLLVAAFDFGTTYSGYAFSFKNDPLKVQTNRHWTGEGLLSLKTPTCVLLDPEGNFNSFGYEAEDKYGSLLDDNEHHGWRLFRRFKMLLHANRSLSRSSTVEDVAGNPFPALQIFTMAIKYLRNHFIEAVNMQTTGVLESDVQYVLTVPAIWDDNAKQFMREAAINAGIDDKRLKMALEPEAASIWCEKINTEAKAALAEIGAKYMVVDLGGGTADLSVHEKMPDGTLKEIHPASGGPWGGIYVDQNYIKTLAEIFGSDAIRMLQTRKMSDYLDLLAEFETKKRAFNPDTTKKIYFRISLTLRQIAEENYGKPLPEIIAVSPLKDKVSIVKSYKLRIDISVVQSWFDEPVDNVVRHVNKLLNMPDMQDVKAVLLVGGFGDSVYVKKRLRDQIGTRRLIVPEDSGLVVLKGAVRFGHECNIISSRVMRYTYGISVFKKFDEEKDPVSKRKEINGKVKAADCFKIFVRRGDTVLNDQLVVHSSFANGPQSSLRVYRTQDKDPSFVTDEGCEFLGKLKIQNPGYVPNEKWEHETWFLFGNTELIVLSKSHRTGKERCLVVDCLNTEKYKV